MLNNLAFRRRRGQCGQGKTIGGTVLDGTGRSTFFIWFGFGEPTKWSLLISQGIGDLTFINGLGMIRSSDEVADCLQIINYFKNQLKI